jgi:phosphoribosylformylglycinamidine synthase
LATTDNLNFGNPEKPEIMGQFVEAIGGIGEACLALGTPIVSGNVSLYNETDGVGILPTPTIGAVGLIEDASHLIHGFAAEGDVALLLGETHGHLGQSALLAEALGQELGDAPPVDLDAEAAHGSFVRAQAPRIRACTDLADGGLALAGFEMAEAADIGLRLDVSQIGQLFGEDQGRYLIACTAEDAEALLANAEAAGLPLARVGTFGGTDIAFGAAQDSLETLKAIYRSSFEAAFH